MSLDLSSSRIQMAALGHTSTPFCFVIRQFLGFFPCQVHLSEVSFKDIYPVLPSSSLVVLVSFVTSEFPVCCLTSCSRVVDSQDVSQPSELSFFNYIFQFPWTSFLSDVFIFDLVPPCDTNSLLWNSWRAVSNFSFVWFCTIQQGWDDKWLIKPDFHGEAGILVFPDVY